jgi:class 3 adenylate cyclase
MVVSSADEGWGHGRKRGDLVSLGDATARPPGLPEGVVTFLLTDIEGSMPLWETHRAAMGRRWPGMRR